MSNAIQVRLATKADLHGVNELEQACFQDHCYPDFFFRQALDCWPEGLLVAKDARGTIFGYLLATTSAERHLSWILSLAVCEKQRGKGVGLKLISQFLTQLSPSITQVNLTVSPDNSAQSLYLRIGFVQQGFEPDYFGKDEPRILMSYTTATES